MSGASVPSGGHPSSARASTVAPPSVSYGPRPSQHRGGAEADALAPVSARPSRLATLARVQSIISGFAATGARRHGCASVSASPLGDAPAVPRGVVATEAKPSSSLNSSELVCSTLPTPPPRTHGRSRPPGRTSRPRRPGGPTIARGSCRSSLSIQTPAAAPAAMRSLLNPDRDGRDWTFALHSNEHGRPLPRLHPRALSAAPQLRGHRGRRRVVRGRQSRCAATASR